jgi:hypothetical protein
MTLDEARNYMVERVKMAKYNGRTDIDIDLDTAIDITAALIEHTWDDNTDPIGLSNVDKMR